MSPGVGHRQSGHGLPCQIVSIIRYPFHELLLCKEVCSFICFSSHLFSAACSSEEDVPVCDDSCVWPVSHIIIGYPYLHAWVVLFQAVIEHVLKLCDYAVLLCIECVVVSHCYCEKSASDYHKAYSEPYYCNHVYYSA